MSGKTRRLVAASAVLLGLWWGLSEWKLASFEDEFNLVADFKSVRARQPDLLPSRISWPGFADGATCEVSWSAGSKSYLYCKLLKGNDVVFDFWGTSSLTQSPKVWLGTESDNAPPQILTYQPSAFPSDTPLGQIRSGYYLWKFNGKTYTASKISLCPLNLWLRNPFPLQD
jgi:hypothetical protein